MRSSVEPVKVTDKVFMVGNSDMTDGRDCSVYLLDLKELVLVDTGAGMNTGQIVRNIELLGFDPSWLTTVLLTHCHIDHVGGASYLKERFGARIIMHELDAQPVERGDMRKTGASWYNIHFVPLAVDVKLQESEEVLTFGSHKLVCLHTPGHTPGSLSIYMDSEGKRILFGQDIHGPFLPEFGADLVAWRNSMETLLALDADILCEGHFGVYHSKNRVKSYIESYLDQYG
ncbi:MAG: Metallo-beta-lactamase L1 precursor [Syntrophorhabdaceae bacterium PtaU1.Bin034]|nr:MAG: Metallo-beta-lactamase L1 precursor [Syntrophorhabdaceae bacterium PtaU1.Bin034]